MLNTKTTLKTILLFKKNCPQFCPKMTLFLPQEIVKIFSGTDKVIKSPKLRNFKQIKGGQIGDTYRYKTQIS